MRARPGDWLIVHSRTDSSHSRQGEILATHADGAPPYNVRWLDDDHESVVFPGPDAQVVTADEQTARDSAQSELISRVQSTIDGRHTAG